MSVSRGSPEPGVKRSPTVLIRADATREIGTGHLMRTLALAQAWKRRGGRAVFLAHCSNGSLLQRIGDAGFDLIQVENPFPHPDDLKQTLSEAGQEPDSKWIVLDGYHFTPDYHSALQRAGKEVLVIDDFNHLPSYHADLLLNQNMGAQGLKYHCDPATTFLLGTRFALLRPEFLSVLKRGEEPEVARRILITMGGADPGNATAKVLNGLLALGDADLEVRVILGPSNPYLDSIAAIIEKAPFMVEILRGVEDMVSCMMWADMAITAGGSTCLELARLGVPFLIVVTADNQEILSKGLQESGAAWILARNEELNPESVARAACSFREDRKLRSAFSRRGSQLVDGLGPSRVAETMDPTKLEIRKARESDCEWIWKVSNDPAVREASFSTEPIPLGSHRAWFSARMSDPNNVFYVGKNQHGAPVGQVRFEIKDGEAEISASLCPEFRTLGLGRQLIRMGSERVMEEKKTGRVRARIKQGNLSSLKAFEGAGYRLEGEERHCGVPVTRMIYEEERS